MKVFFSIPTKELMNDNCENCRLRFICGTNGSIRVGSRRISDVFDDVMLINAVFDLDCPNMLTYDFNKLNQSRYAKYKAKKWSIAGNKLFVEFVRVR